MEVLEHERTAVQHKLSACPTAAVRHMNWPGSDATRQCVKCVQGAGAAAQLTCICFSAVLQNSILVSVTKPGDDATPPDMSYVVHHSPWTLLW